MKLNTKLYDELTLDELYEILKIRVDVFVVEQNCPYPELDGVDKYCYHVMATEGEALVGYLRVIPAGIVYDTVSIGRVISLKRRCGIATELLHEGIAVAKQKFQATSIKIGAQTYAEPLYQSVGFVSYGKTYLEDGLPHICMELKL